MNCYPDESFWVAVQVRSRHEQIVALHLRYKGYEEFVPTYMQRVKSDRAACKDAPLFPGYVFCRYKSIGIYGLILTTPGVIRILGAPGKPSPVCEEEIISVRKIVSSGMPSGPAPYQMYLGKKVRIASGAFAGMTGTVVRVKNKHRLIVSVELLRKAVAVEIDFNTLPPVEISVLLPTMEPSSASRLINDASRGTERQAMRPHKGSRPNLMPSYL